jgi:hypothetical protein
MDEDDNRPAPARWQLAGLISVISALCLGPAPASAQFLHGPASNIGDVPGNGASALPNCSEVSFLGPMIWAYCTDSSNLVIKSKIDVRTCVGYLVVSDASGHLVCRQPVKQPSGQ